MKGKLFQALIIIAYAALPVLAVLTDKEENENVIVEKDFYIVGDKKAQEVSVYPYFKVGSERENVYVPMEVFLDFKKGEQFNFQNEIHSLTPETEFVYQGTMANFLKQIH